MNAFSLLSLIWLGAAQEVCYLPLDVMFLQDTTGSFDDDLPNVVKQIPEMVDSILAEHPSSWFGVAEFKDKPYYPLGETTDFCYKLGDGKLSPNMDDFNWAYSGLYASGGGDLPEAVLQALIDIAYDSQVGWRPLATTGARAAADEAGARLVILSTDAVPHLPGDIDKFDPVQYPDLPRNLPPNSGGISTGDVSFECLHQDYPSSQQMQAALASRNIYLAILTPNDPAIVSAWQWVNEDLLGQPADFYQFISADSSDLLEGVLNAVAAVTSYLCPTTTIPPSTAAPTSTTSLPTTTTTEKTSTAAPTVPAVTTSSDAAVTPVGSVEEVSTLPPATSPEAAVTCPPCEHPCANPCHCCPAVVIKLAEKPSYLRVDYQK